ncbi:hypothetical protein BDR03DRAFT_1001367 [Suillus americanus]|nr:hypothetical protein BDR03DRAFT_1001367 [Suillus americanus]
MVDILRRSLSSSFLNVRHYSTRSYEFEPHTASLLVKTIEENGWTSGIDLVEGGHINLLFTEKEAKMRARTSIWHEYGTPYPRFRKPGHNVWPLRLVTKLYQHAQAHAGQYAFLSLHTRTPATTVTHETTDNSSTYTVVTNRGPAGIIPTRVQVMTPVLPLVQIKLTPSLERKRRGSREAVSPSYELYVDDDSETHPLVGQAPCEFLPSVFEGTWSGGGYGRNIWRPGRGPPPEVDKEES